MKIEDKNITNILYSPALEGHMDAELRRHAKQLIKQQEQILKQKLEKQQHKQDKINQIEVNFVKWAENKNQRFQEKHEKVEKNKEDKIAKIVKRCQDRDKYVVKKHQDYKIVKKKKMNVDWKKAEKFNQDIQTYYKSKNFMSKTLKSGKSGESLHIQREPEEEDNKQVRRSQKSAMNQSLIFMNNSKMYNSMNNQSTFFNLGQSNIQKNQLNLLKKPQNIFYTEVQHDVAESADFKDKFFVAMEKMKEKQKNEQLSKIQHLGTKYSKIQQSRSRKIQIQKKKLSRNSPQRERNLTSYESDNRINKIGKKKGSKPHADEKMNSEDDWRRETRVRDRTQQGKQRRQEMFDKHMEAGDEYLQNLRVKHLKTVLAKNIAYNAMERRLFLERLKS